MNWLTLDNEFFMKSNGLSYFSHFTKVAKEFKNRNYRKSKKKSKIEIEIVAQ